MAFAGQLRRKLLVDTCIASRLGRNSPIILQSRAKSRIHKSRKSKERPEVDTDSLGPDAKKAHDYMKMIDAKLKEPYVEERTQEQMDLDNLFAKQGHRLSHRQMVHSELFLKRRVREKMHSLAMLPPELREAASQQDNTKWPVIIEPPGHTPKDKDYVYETYLELVAGGGDEDAFRSHR